MSLCAMGPYLVTLTTIACQLMISGQFALVHYHDALSGRPHDYLVLASKSAIVTLSWFFLAANKAASLTILASAPTKPVPLRWSRRHHQPGPSLCEPPGSPLALVIWSRHNDAPVKRPALKKLSRTSGRLVAARMMTPGWTQSRPFQPKAGLGLLARHGHLQAQLLADGLQRRFHL